jgi:hypothetical protein
MMHPAGPPRTNGEWTFPITPEMFTALAQAIAGGVQQVTYGDRTIKFYDLADLLKAWQWLGLQLGMGPGGPVRRSTCFSKGLGAGGSWADGGIEHQEYGPDVLFSRGAPVDPTRTDDVDWNRAR